MRNLLFRKTCGSWSPGQHTDGFELIGLQDSVWWLKQSHGEPHSMESFSMNILEYSMPDANDVPTSCFRKLSNMAYLLE